MNCREFAGIVILIFVFAGGCAQNYGKINKQTGTGDKVTLAELRENWEDYDVYYGMRSGRRASAIIFDPKDNGTRLTGDSWKKIEDQGNLDARTKEIDDQYSYARVRIIQGADNQAFGYIYYPSHLQVPVKEVDERTLHVSSLPPYKSVP